MKPVILTYSIIFTGYSTVIYTTTNYEVIKGGFEGMFEEEIYQKALWNPYNIVNYVVLSQGDKQQRNVRNVKCQ